MISDDLAQQWARWMRAAGMSSRTINERVDLVGRFERSTRTSSLVAEWETIADFLAIAGSKPGTRQTYHNNLRQWYRWLAMMDLRIDDPTVKLKSPKTPRRRPRPVTIEQLSAMLATPMHPNTRVMILLGAYEGFRCSEIANVRGQDIGVDNIQVTGKGGVEDNVPLHELVAEAAAAMPSRGYWFPSPVNPGPVRGKSVSAMISHVMRRAGITDDRLTPHSLRHFYGTENLVTSGGNIRVVQELMRHANIASTAIYTQTEETIRRAAVDALPRPHAAHPRAA